MRKNSFKKLSLVLALAMVFSVLAPAAGVFAAKAPELNSGKKYLHLGREESNTFNFNIKNKEKGWSYEWTSANEKVATVNPKNGVTTATGVGKTKVSVEITDKKTGDFIDELVANVIVRDNIEELTITNTPENDTLAVGEDNNFNRDFVTEAGKTNKTSGVTRWTVEPDTATIADNGVFVAEEAGEYTITALSFQSKAKWEDWKKDNTLDYVTAEAEYVVTVANAMEVKQLNKNQIEVTFNSSVEDANDIEVSRLIGATGTKVKEVVKEIKLDDEKKVATVTLYVDLTADTVYVVDYPEVDSVQVTAATYKVEDVTDLAIATDKVVEGEATEIEVKLYNKDGVDITTEDLLAYVDITAESDKAWYNSVENELTIFVKGDTAKVKATFHTYDYDPNTGEELGAITRERLVYAVEEATVEVGALAAWTIAKAGEADFDKVNRTIAAEDQNYKMFVRTNLTNSDDYKSNVDGSEEYDANFTFETSDNTTLIVGVDGTLYPVKSGSAVVVVKYDDKVVDAIRLTIGAKRTATSLTLDNYTVTLSNANDVDDQATVKISLKDQYGQDVDLDTNNSEVKLNATKLTGSLTAEGAIGSKEIVFAAKDQQAGTYTYTVKANGLTKVVVVNVQGPKDETTSFWRLKLSNTSFDTALDSDTKKVEAKINVVGYAANNVANEIISVSGASVTGGSFVVEVTRGNDDISFTLDTDNETGIVKLAEVATGEAFKEKAGTYKVTLKQILDNGAVRIHDIQYFEVKDTQKAPSLTVDKVMSDAGSLEAAINDCFTVKLGSDELAIVDYDTIGTEGTVYVKTVTAKQIVDGGFIEHTVTVNRTISFE